MDRREAIFAYCWQTCSVNSKMLAALCNEVNCPLWRWRLGDRLRAQKRFESAIKNSPEFYKKQLADCDRPREFEKGF